MTKLLSRILGCAAWIALLLAAVGLPALPAQAAMNDQAAPGATITVTSTADAGPGTLRQALLDAHAGDTITFSSATFPLASPTTIAVLSPLPNLSQGNLTIDASNAGVILDGSGIGDPNADGLVVVSNSNVIRGLAITRFPRIAIHIVVANGNIVGGDATVGGAPAGQGNVLTRNGDAGIYVGGGSGNIITGNCIGVNAAGAAGEGNLSGILLREGTQNSRIGGSTSGERNVISGNQTAGIQILDPNTTGNIAIGNYVGTDANGAAAIGNGYVGIAIMAGAQHNQIGATTPGDRNIISGNGGGGVLIEGLGSAQNVVKGNFIGTDASGTARLPNGTGGKGVFIRQGAADNIVEDNLISGNDYAGIEINGTGTDRNVVRGNRIGTDWSGTAKLGNREKGVFIFEGARDNRIGGTTVAERNLISGNMGNGVQIEGAGTDRNLVIGNFVGTDVNGAAAVANGDRGVWITSGAQNNRIGGIQPGEGNLISGNRSQGVGISGSGTANNTVSGNRVGVYQGTARQAFPADLAVSPAYAADCTIYVATLSTGVHKSTDCGASWAEVNNGLTQSRLLQVEIPPDAQNANTAYALAENGDLFLTTNGGTAWTLASSVLQDIDRRNLALSARFANDHTMYASASGWTRDEMGGPGVFKSTDGGAHWARMADGLSDTNIDKVVASPDPAASSTVFALTQGSLFRSTDGAAHWSAVAYPSPGMRMNDLALSPAYATDHRLFAALQSDANGQICASSDGGNSWQCVNALRGDPWFLALSPAYPTDHTVCHGGGWNDWIYCSSDGGTTWAAHDTGLSGGLNRGGSGIVFTPNFAASKIVFMVSVAGMAKSGDRGVTWQSVNSLRAIGNQNGISIEDGAAYNTIGPANLVSNNHFGITLDGGDTQQNTVTGNRVGTDSAGASAQSNSEDGITLWGGHDNLIGGAATGAGNLVSGTVWGAAVRLNGSQVVSNTVAGNFIGTNAAGSAVIGNCWSGVAIHNGASYNRIGGSTPTERNIIGGNSSGVYIGEATTRYNVVTGNYIGTDVTGQTALANRSDGITLGGGASYNRIGGSTPGERNLISGNVSNGINLWGSGTQYNVMIGNYVGVDASGNQALGNGENGINLGNGPSDNRVGGAAPGEGNVIAASRGQGVGIWDTGTDRNVVAGNRIGTNAGGSVLIGNGDCGVMIGRAAQSNPVGGTAAGAGNLIAGNPHGGVCVWGTGTTGNAIRRNAIYDNKDRPDNTNQGIRLWGGGNADLPAPVLTAWDQDAGTVSGTACPGCTVEVFSDREDQGRYYEGTTTAAADGTWSFARGAKFTGNHPTAAATDAQGNTSPFSLVPFIRINWTHDWVDGRTPLPDTLVKATLFDAAGLVKGQGASTSNADAWFNAFNLLDDQAQSADILPGDVVSVTIGSGVVIRATVVDMTGDVDIATNTVTGHVAGGSAGQQVRAELFEVPQYPGDAWGTLLADGSFAMHVDTFTIRDGSMVALWWRSDQGDYIGIVRHWLGMNINIGDGDVWGGTLAGAAVQLVATDESGVVKGSAATVANDDGGYGATLRLEGQPIVLAAGDWITATTGSRTSAMRVPVLTGVLDFDTDAICGLAPPGSAIYINMWPVASLWEYRSDWLHVDSSGHYCLAPGFDLGSDHRGIVIYYDELGHRTQARLTSEPRNVTALSLGTPAAGSVASLAYGDYAVEVAAGQRLAFEVTPGSGATGLWVYGRFGELPTRAHYDQWTQRPTAAGKYELLVAPTRAGIYYFSVFGWDVSAGKADFNVLARTLDRRLADVQPRSGSNTGGVTVALQGLGFVEGMRVELRRAGAPAIAATGVSLASYTALSAHFDLTGTAPAVYDMAAIWPDNAEQTLPGAFQVFQGTLGARLEASLEVPDYVRPGRTFVAWIDYANRGDVDMVAPVFVVNAPSYVMLRLAETEPFESRPAQAMGINGMGGALAGGAAARLAGQAADRAVGFGAALSPAASAGGLAGNLPPGATGRIPVYFQVAANTPGHTRLQIDLATMISDTQPIDWSAVEQEVRPADVDPQTWAVLWPSLTAQIGGTWGNYRQALANDASYLSLLGRTVYSVRDLWRYEIRKALGMNPRSILAAGSDAECPAPGLPLRFSRVFPGSLEGRFYLGPLGRGWTHNYDISVVERANGDVLLRAPGSFARLFRLAPGGAYTPLPGDHGTLTRTSGIFRLAEKEGVTYVFHSDGKLDYLEDRNGNGITAIYDGSGRLVRLQHSDGDHLDFAYNAQGRLAQLTDCAGRATAYGYDASGEHLVLVTAPGSRVTAYGYQAPSGKPADHALLAVTKPDGRHQFFAYDNLGRLSDEHLDGNAEQVTYAYDVYGRVQMADNAGQAVRLGPDEQGRPARMQDGLGRALDQQYSPYADLTMFTDPSGQQYGLAYDRQGNLLSTQDPLGRQLKLDYDYRFSQISTLQDGRGNQSNFSYDAAGNLAAITDPAGRQERFEYDAAGNPTRFTARGGQVINYVYTAKGQLQRKTYGDGPSVDYTYDAAGNLTSASDANGTIQMQYDPATNRLTRITYPSGHWFAFTYDQSGRRTRREGDDGYILSYGYDAAGRLASLTDGANKELVRYEYDAAGRVIRETRGNGTYTTYEYDAAGQVLHLVNCAPGGAVQSRFDYTYDANGNPTSMTTLAGKTTYEYDLAGQLTGVTYPGGRHVTYAYDAAGNRTSVTDNGSPTTYTANNLDQYTQVGSTQYSYDANGNLVASQNATGTTNYLYDAENRLMQIITPHDGTWQFVYDALGNRISTNHDGVVTRYVHDPAGLVDVTAEYDGSGVLAARYIHGAGLVARIAAAGPAAYYAFDAAGHTRQLTDPSGAVANTYGYDPFGVPLATNETVPNPFRYAGREGTMGTGTGTIFMRARYYDPALGRFLSPDPTGLEGGINLYAYCANSPTGCTDPSGMSAPYWLRDPLLAFIHHGNYLGKYRSEGRTVEEGEGGAYRWPEGKKPIDIADEAAWLHDYLHRQGVPGAAGIAKRFLRERMMEKERLGIKEYWWSIGFLIVPDAILDSGLKAKVGQGSTEVITPDDPNEKAGPAGRGAERAVSPGAELQYTIFFENKPTAGAPAQEAMVVDMLDPDLDWSTFRLMEIAWGDQVIAVPGETGAFATRQTVGDHRPGQGKSWWVNVAATIDYSTGRAAWTLRTLDPQTGELPSDPLAGFLPPDDASGRGAGHVAFTVRARRDVPDGTLVANRASITFDTNDPIVTNEWLNRIQKWRVYLPVVVR